MKFTTLVAALVVAVANAQTASPSSEPSLKPSQSPSDEPSLKPSQSPSDEPSLKPSASPSLKPSQSPSDEPSLKPSASPSDDPSLTPSASPSLKPSGQPSDVPSLKPSASPSDAPSLEPSTSPSMSPSVSGMPSSLPSAPPTKPMPQIEVDFTDFCFNLVNTTTFVSSSYPFWGLFGDAIEGAIIDLMTPELTTPGQRILKVSVTSVDNVSTENRRLEASEYDILKKVKYDVLFEQFCTRGNCDDATTLTATVSDLITTTIDDAIEKGTLHTSIRAKMAANDPAIDGTLNWVELATGDCTPSTVVNSILPMMWYPDWDGANEGCIMDGNEAEYMRLNPEGFYLFATLEECCTRHYQWDYNNCAGIASTAVGPDGAALYYPDWEGDNKSCKNDGSQPTYMTNNIDAWMFEDLETCCKARYSWNLEECMGAAAAAAATGTNKWYVDYENSKCLQDCVGAAPCGGLAESWDTTYDTPADCCSNKLNWINQETCVAMSNGAVVAGSDKWYVDYTTETCKQDCDGAKPCGGLAESWEQTFDTVGECCREKLSWVSNCGPYN